MQEADTISRDISWEKWNLLSPVEISVLKSLNFNLLPEKKKKENRVRFAALDPQHATAPKPHLTDVAVTCSFCKTRFHVYFDMSKLEVGEQDVTLLLRSYKPLVKASLVKQTIRINVVK